MVGENRVITLVVVDVDLLVDVLAFFAKSFLLRTVAHVHDHVYVHAHVYAFTISSSRNEPHTIVHLRN